MDANSQKWLPPKMEHKINSVKQRRSELGTARMHGEDMENVDQNAVLGAVLDDNRNAVADKDSGSVLVAKEDTPLPPFEGGSKVYSGERWLPMVLDHCRTAWNVENATYIYLLQKGRSVVSLRCENWSRQCEGYAAMLLSGAAREDKFVLEALWRAYKPRQVYPPIMAWLEQKKITNIKPEEEPNGDTITKRRRTVTLIQKTQLDSWSKEFQPLFWQKEAKTHIECTSKLWQDSKNNRDYLEQLIAQQHAKKMQHMPNKYSGSLSEHAMRIGTYDGTFNGNQMFINGCCGVGDKRMRMDDLPYEPVKKTYAVSSCDASWLGKVLENVVYMPPAEDLGCNYENPGSAWHDLEYAGMMQPFIKEAGKFDMPMDSPAVSEEAQKHMQEVFKQCVDTVGLCERLHQMAVSRQNALKLEDHERARWLRKQLGIYMPDHLSET